jgi:hypothetical protein
MPAGSAKVIMLSAGDSHTAALTAMGEVYVWGTFRDSGGVMGFSEDLKFSVRCCYVALRSHTRCYHSAGRTLWLRRSAVLKLCAQSMCIDCLWLHLKNMRSDAGRLMIQADAVRSAPYDHLALLRQRDQ